MPYRLLLVPSDAFYLTKRYNFILEFHLFLNLTEKNLKFIKSNKSATLIFIIRDILIRRSSGISVWLVILRSSVKKQKKILAFLKGALFMTNSFLLLCYNRGRYHLLLFNNKTKANNAFKDNILFSHSNDRY